MADRLPRPRKKREAARVMARPGQLEDRRDGHAGERHPEFTKAKPLFEQSERTEPPGMRGVPEAKTKRPSVVIRERNRARNRVASASRARNR